MLHLLSQGAPARNFRRKKLFTVFTRIQTGRTKLSISKLKIGFSFCLLHLLGPGHCPRLCLTPCGTPTKQENPSPRRRGDDYETVIFFGLFLLDVKGSGWRYSTRKLAEGSLVYDRNLWKCAIAAAARRFGIALTTGVAGTHAASSAAVRGISPRRKLRENGLRDGPRP